MKKSLSVTLRRSGTIMVVFAALALPALAQTCQSSVTSTQPSSDYSVHSNGSVTHNTTGLMWQQCALGHSYNNASNTCDGTASSVTWAQALTSASTNTFLGHNDWRLPNIKELASIVERACYSPAINTAIFLEGSSTWFWSSSPLANSSDYAWNVHFNYGFDSTYSKSNNAAVRLVRGGQ